MRKYFLFVTIFFIHLIDPFHTTAQYSQTVSNGGITTPVSFNGCQTVWTNDNPGIGLLGTGSGDIPSFRAINTGSTPIIATITANPVATAYVQYSDGSGPSVINTATGAIVSTLPLAIVGKASTISPDQQYVYMQSSAGIVRISTRTGVITTFNTPGLPPAYNFVLNASGSLLYLTTQGTNQVIVLNASSMTIYATINLGAPGAGLPEIMALTPDGAKLYVTDSQTGTLHVINTTSNTVATELPLFAVNDICYGVAVSPDGARLYVTDQNANTVQILSTTSNTVTATIPVTGGPSYCVLSTDGSRLYVGDEIAKKVTVINTVTNSIVATITVGTAPISLDLSPDGTQLYVLNFLSRSISVINTATNSLINTIRLPSTPDSWGRFIASPCGPVPIAYTITVNPSPAFTTSAVSGMIEACAGAASASPDIQTFSVSGSYLMGNVVATAPPGFELSLTPGSGFGSEVTITQTGGSVNSIPIYVRSSASISPGGATGNVILSTTDAADRQVAIAAAVSADIVPLVTVAASPGSACAETPITFTANTTNGGTAPVYQWTVNGANVGDNGPSFITSELTSTDQVACTVTSNLACALPGTSIPVQIEIDPQPSVGFPRDSIFIGNAGVQLNPTITGVIARYEWTPFIGLSAGDIANPVADPAKPVTYQLKVVTGKGCTAVAKVTVIPRPPLLMPSAFTPNGDGHNDVFRIPLGANLILEQFVVFNRWGVEVFSTRNIAVGWDGSDHGRPVLSGTYVYLITGKDLNGKPIKLNGTLMVVK